MFPERLAKLKEEISEADKMFEELDYEKIQDNEMWICFDKKNESIKFNLHYKYFEGEERMDGEKKSKSFSIQELQAINKKVEELEWIDTK